MLLRMLQTASTKTQVLLRVVKVVRRVKGRTRMRRIRRKGRS